MAFERGRADPLVQKQKTIEEIKRIRPNIPEMRQADEQCMGDITWVEGIMTTRAIADRKVLLNYIEVLEERIIDLLDEATFFLAAGKKMERKALRKKVEEMRKIVTQVEDARSEIKFTRKDDRPRTAGLPSFKPLLRQPVPGFLRLAVPGNFKGIYPDHGTIGRFRAKIRIKGIGGAKLELGTYESQWHAAYAFNVAQAWAYGIKGTFNPVASPPGARGIFESVMKRLVAGMRDRLIGSYGRRADETFMLRQPLSVHPLARKPAKPGDHAPGKRTNWEKAWKRIPRIGIRVGDFQSALPLDLIELKSYEHVLVETSIGMFEIYHNKREILIFKEPGTTFRLAEYWAVPANKGDRTCKKTAPLQ